MYQDCEKCGTVFNDEFRDTICPPQRHRLLRDLRLRRVCLRPGEESRNSRAAHAAGETMKSAIRITAFALLFTAFAVFAQDKPAPAKPDPNEVTVKDTDANKELIRLAKDQAEDQKRANDIFQQARTSLDQNNKALQDELTKAQKDLNDKIKNDKKYRDDFAHIEGLQKQITDAGAKAQTSFQNAISPIQQKLDLESKEMQGIESVVKRENGFGDDVQFVPATGKWIKPPKK
jgi:hypothetical protein